MGIPTILDTYTQRAPGNTSSDSFSYTVSGGTSTVAICYAFASPSGGQPSSATYNGTSLTVRTFTVANYHVAWGYLINPSNGANTFAINYPSQIRPTYRVFTVQDLLSTVFDVDGNASGSSTTPSKSLTTTVKNTFIFAFNMAGGPAVTDVSGQTAEWSSNVPYVGNEIWAGGSQGQANTGTFASSFTLGVSQPWEELAVAFKGNSAVASASNLALLGAG